MRAATDSRRSGPSAGRARRNSCALRGSRGAGNAFAPARAPVRHRANSITASTGLGSASEICSQADGDVGACPASLHPPPEEGPFHSDCLARFAGPSMSSSAFSLRLTFLT